MEELICALFIGFLLVLILYGIQALVSKYSRTEKSDGDEPIFSYQNIIFPSTSKETQMLPYGEIKSGFAKVIIVILVIILGLTSFSFFLGYHWTQTLQDFFKF